MAGNLHPARARRHSIPRLLVAVAASVPLAAISLTPAAVVAGGQQQVQAVDSAKIAALVAAMTLDEKLAMLKGSPGAGPADPQSVGQAGFVPGVPRLGIPPLRFTDGPAGVRTNLPSTAMPAPVSLAATFSTVDAATYGGVIGLDAQANHQDVLFGPMVNLVRVPQGGRDFETLGEDPFLMSQLVGQETRGVQSQGTIVTIKHFAENNQENQRQTINVNVDEQTLREIELPAFQASIDGGAGAVMCAYNSVNGLHSCENPTLLTDILRTQWGFTGWVLSDYGANHSTKPNFSSPANFSLPIDQCRVHTRDRQAVGSEMSKLR